MKPPRILLIAHDSLLATCYGEALAGAGFHVQALIEGRAALSSVEGFQPDAVLVDLLLPDLRGDEVIAQLRANPATHQLPILAFPTALEPVARAAVASGVSQLIERSSHPVAGVVRAMEQCLYPGNPAIAPANLDASEAIRERCHSEMPEKVSALRNSLQKTHQQSGLGPVLPELVQGLHALCERANVLGRPALFHMAAAMESLSFDLQRMPAQATSSTLRTLTQGIDFLAHLVEADHWNQAVSPNVSRVLIVEDDPNARQIITAAMGLVGLTAESTGTPSETLAIATGSAFDLIFLDVGLPEMTGIELCTKIRQIPIQQTTPIVFLTGMDTFHHRVQSSLSGGNDFIGKPFHLAELGVKALFWVFKGQIERSSFI
jgi:DNA-binding response OmpR family regulator